MATNTSNAWLTREEMLMALIEAGEDPDASRVDRVHGRLLLATPHAPENDAVERGVLVTELVERARRAADTPLNDVTTNSVLLDGEDAPPFILVRVQDDLFDAYSDHEGLRLPYQRDDTTGAARNTSHWAVNSIVADHGYGRFNEAADGSLKGKVVIVADPRDMPPPAGLGQVDTWFRLDARADATGRMQRGLSVGHRAVAIVHASVVIPEGFGDGARLVRYEGGIAERDAAVGREAARRGVTLERAGMWGWSRNGDSNTWAEKMATSIYPESAARIHVGPHTGSLDETIESGARISALLKTFDTERLYARADGLEVLMADVIREAIAEQREAVQTVLRELPNGERRRVEAFYLAREEELTALSTQNEQTERRWEERLSQSSNPIQSALVPPPLPGAVAADVRFKEWAFPPPLPAFLPPGSLNAPAPPSMAIADAESVTREEILICLLARGEDPEVERVAEIHGRLGPLISSPEGREAALYSAIGQVCEELDQQFHAPSVRESDETKGMPSYAARSESPSSFEF
jgi:hypothetical protein